MMLLGRLPDLLLEPGVFSLGAAAVLGAAHALTPGHGKTAVAAYLAGIRGNAFDAIRLGLIVTFTHTASVFVLALAAHYLAEQVDIQQWHPLIGRLSGIAIALMGVWLLYQRLRPAAAEETSMALAQDHHGLPLNAMGISSGMVPCPEALTLLWLALSRGQSLYGFSLLLSFSVGLAFILVGIGLSAVAILPATQKFQQLSRVLPLMSALVLITVGILMAL
jgi:nickel/cobalt exporter